MKSFKLIRNLFPICADLTGGYTIDCDNPATAGVNDRLVLLNFANVTTITRNVTNKNIVEAISVSDTGFVFEGMNNSHQPSAKYVKKTYGFGLYDHIVKFLIFNNSPAIKDQAERMMKGRTMAIVENNQGNANGNGAFEIFGLNVGLVGIDLVHDKNNEENPGFEITLGSPEKAKEPHLPASLFITDYATSKAVVDGLL